MKYYVQKNTERKHGYELVIIDDAGSESIQDLPRKTPDNCLYMPDEIINAVNRKFVSINMLEKAGQDRFELTYREPREPRNLSKPLTNYMSDEDKIAFANAQKIIEEIIEKAKIAKANDKVKPLTALEKAQLAVKKAQAKLDALLNK